MNIQFTTTMSERGPVVTVQSGDASYTRYCPTILSDDKDVGPQVKFCETSITALQTFIENKGSEYTSDGLKKAIKSFVIEIANGCDGLIGRTLVKKSAYDRDNYKNQTPTIDTTNNADAIKRMDIRKWFNDLSMPAKAEAIMAKDVNILAAILEVGPVVSGLNEDMHALAVQQHEILTWADNYFRQEVDKGPTATYADILPKKLTIKDFMKAGDEAYHGHHKQKEVFKAVEDYVRGIVDLIAMLEGTDGPTTFDRLFNA